MTLCRTYPAPSLRPIPFHVNGVRPINLNQLPALALAGALSLTLLSGCGKKEGTTLKVGATPAPTPRF